MKVVTIWLRRGTGPFLALAVLAILWSTLLPQRDWRIELDWATRLSAGPLLLICPGVAAAAAFDTARRLRPTLAYLSRGSTRPSAHLALPALAVIAWASFAYVLTWVLAAGVVAASSGVGVTAWWVFPEIIGPMVGAGAVGMLAGMAVGGAWASPLAAVAILAGAVAASPWGRGPFEAVTTYGTLTGLERPAHRAMAAIAGALVVAFGAVLAALELQRPAARARGGVVFSCTTAILLGALAPAAWPWRQDIYVFTSEPYGCIGQAPSVCGPKSRLPLVRPMQAALAGAYRKLEGTDFTKPTSFRVTRLDHYSELQGAAPLDFDPALLNEGRSNTWIVASALLRPSQCLDWFDAPSSKRISDAQDRARPWLEEVLAGGTPARPVPAAVASAFKVVEGCTAMTWDLH